MSELQQNLTEVFQNDSMDFVDENSFDDMTLSEHVNCQDYPEIRSKYIKYTSEFFLVSSREQVRQMQNSAPSIGPGYFVNVKDLTRDGVEMIMNNAFINGMQVPLRWDTGMGAMPLFNEDGTIREKFQKKDPDMQGLNVFFYPSFNCVMTIQSQRDASNFAREDIRLLPLYKSGREELCQELSDDLENLFNFALEMQPHVLIRLSSNQDDYAITQVETMPKETEDIMDLSQVEWEDVLHIADKLRLVLLIEPLWNVSSFSWTPSAPPLPISELASIQSRSIRVFNPITLEETSLRNALRDNNNDDKSLIFLVLNGDNEPAPVAFTISVDQLSGMLQRKEFYYQCSQAIQGMYPMLDEIDESSAFLRLPFSGQYYVLAGQVQTLLLDGEHGTLFALQPDLKLDYTTSAESVRLSQQDYVNFRGENISGLGADHCQDNSDKRLFRIFKVKLIDLPPSLSPSPASATTPETIRERRSRLRSLDRRMQDARETNDIGMIRTLMRERTDYL